MQFGKFSADELRLLLTLLPVFDREAADTKEKIKLRREQFFTGPFAKVNWCNLYEMPISEHVGRIVAMAGMEEEVKKWGATPEQPQTFSDALTKIDEEIASDTLAEEEPEDLKLAAPALFAVAISLHNTFRCLLTFGCYLNYLIAQVRDGNDPSDRALFNAVRIDRTVLGCPSVITRISRATILDETRFFAKLQSALSGKLRKREQANFQKMRFILQTLVETGADRLSDEQLHELFVKQLRLYASDSKRGDVKKNLRKFANQYMKAATTKKATF